LLTHGLTFSKSDIGQKTFFGEAQAPNLSTHSYIIQPIVYADDRLLPALLVCLQGTGGPLSESNYV